jgi:threonine dehydrogenase-like Zn-dependent dehydrogenase
MRAGVLRGGRLAVVDVADSQPEPGQLLVRILVCGICGTDLHFVAMRRPSCRSTTSYGPP